MTNTPPIICRSFHPLVIGHWSLAIPFRISLLFLLTFNFYLLASCAHPVKPAAPAANLATPTPDSILLASDPCALRMQDIASAMIVYLNTNQSLPAGQEQLRPAAARVGLTLDFTCPLSHLPYIYYPSGLSTPGDPRRLVLYDATAAHENYRWGILILPAQGTHPLTADVVRLTDPMLKAYLKSTPSP